VGRKGSGTPSHARRGANARGVGALPGQGVGRGEGRWRGGERGCRLVGRSVLTGKILRGFGGKTFGGFGGNGCPNYVGSLYGVDQSGCFSGKGCGDLGASTGE